MKKETYQKPNFNVIELDAEDVITSSQGGTSGGGGGWTEEGIPSGPPMGPIF